MLMRLRVRRRRQIITETAIRTREELQGGEGKKKNFGPPSRGNFDPSMSTARISSSQPSLPPRGCRARSTQRWFSQHLIPSEPSQERGVVGNKKTHKKKKHSGIWYTVGGVTSGALTGLCSECKCGKNQQNAFAFTNTVHPVMWSRLLSILSGGVSQQRGLQVYLQERGVQRWAPMRIPGEMARVWSPIRCQPCFGC